MSNAKSYEYSKSQVMQLCHRWIEDVGEAWRKGGRAAMFGRASDETGIPEGRLRTIFYDMGASVAAEEYLTIQARWQQLRLDADTAHQRTIHNQLGDRLAILLSPSETDLLDPACASLPLSGGEMHHPRRTSDA